MCLVLVSFSYVRVNIINAALSKCYVNIKKIYVSMNKFYATYVESDEIVIKTHATNITADVNLV